MTEFASVPGARLAYDVAGAGDPPMIFVHGWCCDRSYFAPQARHFSASHAVVTVDLRGHGESGGPQPGPGAYDIAVLADDVLAVAAAAAFRQPVLVGHSLGALIGLSCAARPGALRALIMIDPAPITNEQAKTFLREPAPRLPTDHDRPDCRRRSLHPARSPRAGERHDRTIPGDHRPASTPMTGDRALATSGSRSPIAFAASAFAVSVRAQRIRVTAASGWSPNS